MSMQAWRWLSLVAFINSLVILDGAMPWGEQQIFPYQNIPDNALSPNKAIVRRKIVLYHNFFRTKVSPTASNMLVLTWHKGAAKQAQWYAEQCRYLQHNDPSENSVRNLGACGQNLFVAAQKTPWFFAIKTWFLEYRNFTYGAPILELAPIGHYTQMSWATSHKLGCGVAKCSGGPWGHFYNYVCHYCPGGNIEGIAQYPYKPGPPCADCKDRCISGKLCTNVCPVKDEYSNCGELHLVSNDLCRRGICNATCFCSDRVHKNYPWK